MNQVACKITGINAGMEFSRVYYEPTFVDFNQMRGAGPIDHLREIFSAGVGFKVTFDVEHTGALFIPKGGLKFSEGDRNFTGLYPFWLPAGASTTIRIGKDLEFTFETFTVQAAQDAS